MSVPVEITGSLVEAAIVLITALAALATWWLKQLLAKQTEISNKLNK